MKFMNQKSWHPSSLAMQKKIYIAEAEAAGRDRKNAEIENERRKEATRRELQETIWAAQGKDVQSAENLKEMQLGFMYGAPPPGLNKKGDDEEAEEEDDDNNPANDERKKLTLVDKFPYLKNAPVKSDHAFAGENVETTFKPFGIKLRNTQCRHCGEWGHRAGEKECKLVGEPTVGKDVRQLSLDPAAAFSKNIGGGLVLKPKMDAVHGGISKDAENQQFLVSDGEDGEEDDGVVTLSKSERKKLKKELKKLKKKQKKSTKKKKKRGSSSSSDSSDTSDSDDDRRKRARGNDDDDRRRRDDDDRRRRDDDDRRRRDDKRDHYRR